MKEKKKTRGDAVKRPEAYAARIDQQCEKECKSSGHNDRSELGL